MRKSNFIIIMFFSLLSCQNKTFDTVEDITKFINDEQNNYKYSKIVNGVKYVLTYRPTDLMVKQELENSNDKKLIQKLRSKYNKYIYFNLSMSYDDKELLSSVVRNRERFGQMVNDLAFGIKEKVNLYTQKKDTLIMTDFIYPRMYGMTNSSTILIIYPRDKEYLNEKYLNFTIQDLGLNTGEVRFKIETKEILNEPQIQFN